MSDSKKSLRHKDIWTGQHRGICFEIARWELDAPSPPTSVYLDSLNRVIWNYYLILPLAMVPAEHQHLFNLPGKPSPYSRYRIDYDYMSSGVLCGLPWHGGITYYEKDGGNGGAPIYIKAGCDYNHSWDQGREYDVDRVLLGDVIPTIDALHEAAPYLLRRCSWDGRWVKPSDGVEAEGGVFYSNAGIEARKAKWPESGPISLATNGKG